MASGRNLSVAMAGLEGPDRAMIQTNLREVGFEHFRFAHTVSDLEGCTAIGACDLLVVSFRFDEGRGIPFIRKLRMDQLGEGVNPFIPIVVTIWNAEPDAIGLAISSGVDDLLVFPMPTGTLKKRLQALADRRRPFIVTSDYVGPERRRDPNRVSTIPYFEPPNSYAEKVRGTYSGVDSVLAQLAAARREIGEERCRREAFQVAFLARLISEDRKRGADPADLKKNLLRMRNFAGELGRRNESLAGPPIAKILTTLEQTLATLLEGPDPDATDRLIRLLEPVSQALVVSLRDDLTESDLAAEIGDTVATFRSRRREA